MNVTNEIDVLKTVVEALTPLEADARQRVVEYICKALNIEHAKGSASNPEKSPPPPIALQGGKPTPPQQYLRNFNYKIMTKRIGVIAVYLERERGTKRFNFKDITETFREAKESKTPAQSQYARAVVMGYLAKEGDQFYATTKAEELVDSYNARQADESNAEE
jgi:hypothetical protein